jgi:hypothetical protein
MPGTPIAVVEPQMQGVFHAPFNAALLHAVALAWPDTTVSFAAEPSHLREVQALLAQHAPEITERFEWRELPPPPGGALPARWLYNRKLLGGALRSNERVLFSSISRMQLIELQGLMRPSDQVRAVLHGDLERIATPASGRFPASFFSLHRAFAKAPPTGLRYVLLGPSIRASIPEAFTPAFANAAVIEHPYHFLPFTPRPPQPPVLGIFGNAGDGRLLEAFCRAIKPVLPNVPPRLVGFVANEDAAARLQPFIEGVSTQPLSRQDFAARAAQITHALWLAAEDSSRLRASGTFLDALSYATPLVFTANPYLDHYHALEPAIGIGCTSAPAAAQAAVELLRTQTPTQFTAAQQAMLRLRERFTPQAQARTLPAALDWAT